MTSDMSLQELEDGKAQIKKQIDELHEQARQLSSIQAIKIREAHIAEATRSMGEWAEKNGMSLLDAAAYWKGRLTDNGDPGRWIQANLILGLPGKIG